MNSQKGISAIVVILIVFFVLAAGAGVWYYFWNKSRLEPETGTVEEPETEARSSNLKTGILEAGSQKVTFSYPQSWGDFESPTLDSLGGINSGPYEGRGFPGAVMKEFLHVTHQFLYFFMGRSHEYGVAGTVPTDPVLGPSEFARISSLPPAL